MNLTASERNPKEKKKYSKKEAQTASNLLKICKKNQKKAFQNILGLNQLIQQVHIAFPAHMLALLLIFPFGNLFRVELADGISEENKSQCFEN